MKCKIVASTMLTFARGAGNSQSSSADNERIISRCCRISSVSSISCSCCTVFEIVVARITLCGLIVHRQHKETKGRITQGIYIGQIHFVKLSFEQLNFIE